MDWLRLLNLTNISGRDVDSSWKKWTCKHFSSTFVSQEHRKNRNNVDGDNDHSDVDNKDDDNSNDHNDDLEIN